jgi:hypothetical protein
MRDEVQPRTALIVGAHYIGRCMFCIRGFQHLIPSSRIGIPFASSRPKTSLPVTGNLAMEIFLGLVLSGGLRVPTREAVDGPFSKL